MNSFDHRNDFPFHILTCAICALLGIASLPGTPIAPQASADESNNLVSVNGSGNGITLEGEESVVYEEPAASAPSVPSGSGESDGGGAVVVETQQSSCDDRGAGADACRLGELLARATGPAPAPAPAQAAPGGGGRVVVSVHDLAALSLSGSGITRQPPGPQVLSTKPFIVYTSSATRTYTAQILGRAVTIETTPISYLWDFGDGVYLSTTDPGAAWPDHTVWHDYTTTHTQIHTTLTTTWRARYQPAGTSDWRPIPGTLTTTETTTAYDVVRTITYLTDDAEEQREQ